MADADWDAEDFEPVEVKPPAPTDKWDGEDEDDAIKDNWDDDDDAEDDKKKEESSSLPMVKKKKRPIGERIKEKEEKKRKELEERLKKEEEEKAKSTPDEINSEKKRRERLQLESDLELARETFGGSNDDDELSKPSIDKYDPVSKSDFEQLASMLKEKLTTYESSVNYPGFLEIVFRDLVTGLSSDDIKKLGSTLNAVANEKQKQERNVKGKKKKKGPSVKEGGQLTNYGEDYYNEYDDFI